MNLRDQPVDQLFERALAGDRRALGRLLSVAERLGSNADALTDLTYARSSGGAIIGITGAPGAGKSTLVGALIQHVVDQGLRPAVMAVDPSSPLTGGAILGDRVRMAELDAAFIRSIATRGHAGGLALAIPGCARVFDAVGYSPIIIETVGVGQVEVDITAAADTTVVVVTPGMGDAVQANKAGLLEVADIFVVNKADQPGASDTRRDLELMLELSHVTGHEDAAYRPPIVMANSLESDGIAEVWDAVAAHRTHLEVTDGLTQRRLNRARFEVTHRVQAGFEANLHAATHTDAATALLADVAAGKRSPTEAATTISALPKFQS